MLGADVEVRPAGKAHYGMAKCELSLDGRTSRSGGVKGGIEYCIDLFECASVERLARRLEYVAADVAAVQGDSHDEVWRIAMMVAAEAECVLWRFNDAAAQYPTNVCVHELVAVQAARTPAPLPSTAAGA